MDAGTRISQRITSVGRDGSAFEVVLEWGCRLTARAVLPASGAFGRPHRPVLPGLQEFTAQGLHAAGCRSPSPFAGRRVIVVGAGNSALQIAAELASTARVTLATRGPVKFAAQRIPGRDLHLWTARTGLDAAPLGRLLPRLPAQPVLDDGRYRAALAAGQPGRRPLFTGSEGTKLIRPDGEREEFDAIVLATGYRPDLPYLTDLGGALDADGNPGTARASLPTCRGWCSSGWNGSPASRRARCAGSAGTRSGSPGAWLPTSRAGDGSPRTGSTYVNIGVCRMRRRCCRCSNPPTARA
ncbi:NAD(P)-binding domain-containing protein [Streptomyces cyaneofuscatus]|uniref:NAD(P)-binding domain-containing protein n=1 Tax=Streptomyces cyaneofuscatus TaxID=66883 RepID=UPI0033DC6A7C